MLPGRQKSGRHPFTGISKPDLVLGVSAWAWEQYRKEIARKTNKTGKTAAELFEKYLESFIDLYRNHRDLLRLNQQFNDYVRREGLPEDRMQPYKEVIDSLEERFKENYQRGKEDGTLRTDIPEKEMFSATLHLMLAAATRYAVGVICDAGVDPEKELELLKDMLMQRFTVKAEEIQTTP